MTLEWLRRRDTMLDQHLRTYLFTTGSILEREAAAEGSGTDSPNAVGSLGIGDLRTD